MKSLATAFVIGTALLTWSCRCPAPPPAKLGVDVLSKPVAADVLYRGKLVGKAPSSLRARSWEDIQAISARYPEQDVVERRVRILGPDQYEIVFGFGKEPTALAKRLGLTRVLIFENSEEVAFDTGKSELKPGSHAILEKQAEILNLYFPKAQVHVCGFTDSTGPDDLNMKLSFQRAEAVFSFLAERKTDRARMKVQGFGKDFATAPNDTPEGRAQNRRTEIVLPD